MHTHPTSVLLSKIDLSTLLISKFHIYPTLLMTKKTQQGDPNQQQKLKTTLKVKEKEGDGCGSWVGGKTVYSNKMFVSILNTRMWQIRWVTITPDVWGIVSATQVLSKVGLHMLIATIYQLSWDEKLTVVGDTLHCFTLRKQTAHSYIKNREKKRMKEKRKVTVARLMGFGSLTRFT